MVGHPRIGKRKPRQFRDHRSVPVDGPDSDFVGDHRGPDRFRHRCQLEHGVGIDGGALTQLANPESLCVHSLTSVHHGHRHAGNTGTCHEVVREAVELPDRVVDLPVRDRHPGVETRAGVADDRPGREVVSESDEHPASRATVSTTGTAAADSRELFLLVMDTRFSLAGLSSVPLGQPSIGERRADIGTNRETL